MPVTRAMMNKDTKNSNTVMMSNKDLINAGVKRKADGRKILGELDGKNNAKSSLQSRKILTTRLNNKNVASGSETLRNRRTGLKDTTNLEKITNTLKKSLSSMGKSSSSTKDKALREEILEIQQPQPLIFYGHDSFCKVPLSLWRNDLKGELTRQQRFFDYELSVKDNLNESPEYTMGIFEYMKWREQRFEMKPYLDPASSSFQTTFKVNDRRQLIDWMVEFQEIQESTHETLYLAVRLCDYYFSHRKVSREHLQLYAFIGFLLASKFEERWPPMFDDMIQLSDDQYTRDDFTRAEENMLKTLNFDINIPISYRYLRRFAKCISMDMRSMTVSRFYLELTLQEYEFVGEGQSNMAAACLWIAMSTLGYDSEKKGRSELVGKQRYIKKFWSDQLTYYTGLYEWEVVPLARRIASTVRATQTNLKYLPVDDSDEEEMYLNKSLDLNDNYCKVIYKKYASDVFFKVAQKLIMDDNSIEMHLRRVKSEQIDYEATLPPNSKRRSTGCTSKLQKMSLRSKTPNIPERVQKITAQKLPEAPKAAIMQLPTNNVVPLIFTDKDASPSIESTKFYSCERMKSEGLIQSYGHDVEEGLEQDNNKENLIWFLIEV